MNVNKQYSSSSPLKLTPYLQKAFQRRDLPTFIDTRDRLLRILSETLPYTHNSGKDREIYVENLNTLDVVKKAMLLLERGDSTLH